MTAPAAEQTVAAHGAAGVATARLRVATGQEPLPTWRLNVMRVGYLVMAVGIALTKGPLFVQGTVSSLPVHEGVVAALLGSLSLLAFVGLRYPVRLLPLLVLETAWKLLWLVTVAVPNLASGDMSAQMTSVLISVSFVVVIIAVTPWDFVWKHYVRAAGDPWR